MVGSLVAIASIFQLKETKWEKLTGLIFEATVRTVTPSYKRAVLLPCLDCVSFTDRPSTNADRVTPGAPESPFSDGEERWKWDGKDREWEPFGFCQYQGLSRRRILFGKKCHFRLLSKFKKKIDLFQIVFCTFYFNVSNGILSIHLSFHKLLW